MDIDKIVETSYEVDEAVSSVIAGIYTSWQKIHPIQADTLVSEEPRPSQELVKKWRKFAHDTVHAAIKQALKEKE